jgi:hypothetical protein
MNRLFLEPLRVALTIKQLPEIRVPAKLQLIRFPQLHLTIFLQKVSHIKVLILKFLLGCVS